MRNDFGVDQADGLRRLQLANQTQVIAVVAGKSGSGQVRSGSASMTANLAAALSRCGKDVLVLDVAQAGGRLAQSNPNADVVLVDASSCPTALSELTQCGLLLVVVDASASGITAGYALIKRLLLGNVRMQFEIAVNQVADESAAQTVFDNMAKLARRDLAAQLKYLGCIPQDDKVKRATQLGKTVVDAFPTTWAARSYIQMASKLMLLPMRQNKSSAGVPAALRNLLQQPAPSRLAHEMAPVAN